MGNKGYFKRFVFALFLLLGPIEYGLASDDINFVINTGPKASRRPASADDTATQAKGGTKPLATKKNIAPVAEKKPAFFYGYPRFDGSFSIRPGIYSLNQTLNTSGTKFNFSNLNLLDFNAEVRAYFTPRLFASFDARIEHVGTSATDLASYQLQSSSITAISVGTTLNYCFYLGNGETKLCPGIGFGYDNYPILQFTSNVNLGMSQLGDIGLGPTLLFVAPVGTQAISYIKAGYNVGLKQGQSAGYTMTSDHNIYFNADIHCPLSRNLSAIFGLGVFSQSATFASLQDQGTWSMSNLNFIGNIGVRYNFNYFNLR